MHTSGKVAAWLVVVGIVGAVYVSVKALAVRDAWMELAQKNEAAIKKNQADIDEKTQTLDKKRKELARTMLGWDREWQDVTARANPQGGLSLQLAASKGIQQDQVVYVFGINPDKPDEPSTYLGDFKVTKAGDAATETKANSRRRPADKLPAQPIRVRVRTLIPNPYQSRLATLDQQLLAAEQSVASNNDELARQAQLSEQTEKLIALRMAEIEGNPQLEGEAIPAVHIQGLLTGIANEEEARNAALIEADRLMRELKRTRDNFERARKENERLVESLPKAKSAEPAVGAAGR